MSDLMLMREVKELKARITALEKYSHVPFDFTDLVKRLEALERKEIQ